jgi:hypothetical protein
MKINKYKESKYKLVKFNLVKCKNIVHFHFHFLSNLIYLFKLIYLICSVI